MWHFVIWSTKANLISFQCNSYIYVTHHEKRVVPLPVVLLNYPESVVLEFSVKPSLGKPACLGLV